MNNVSRGYAGIKAIIMLLFPTYDPNAIFEAYQNNAKYPNDNLVIMTRMNSYLQGLSPMQAYDTATGTQYYEQRASVTYQVDFYGSLSCNYASIFRLFLITFDCAEYLNNGFSCTVHSVQEERNLTSDLDRSKYKQRYVVRFSLFENISTHIAVPSFSTNNVDIILAESRL